MSTIKFSQALYTFDAFLDAEKNLSPRTRKAYVYDLERFADSWVKRHGSNLAQISTDDIKHYLDHLRMDRHLKSTTMARTIASIRIFFEYCVAQGFLKYSPAAHIHTPRNPKKLPIFLIESELKRLLAAPPVSEEDSAGRRRDYQTLGRRDYAILVTLGFTGVRLIELTGLDVGSIEFEHGTIRVMGKGSKERIIPLNEIVTKALQEWLEVRSPADERETAVFTNRFGRRMSSRAVQNLVEKYVKAAGITKGGVSPHKLRHTFATLLHMNGVDIVEIQALLGHSSITSTQIYTHASSAKLKSAVRKLDLI